MARNDVRYGLSADDKVSGVLDRVRDKFDQVGKTKGFQSIFMGVGLSVGQAAMNMMGQAIGNVTNYIGDAIDAASDLEESQSKVSVVFGDSAKAVLDWSRDSAMAFGLSSQKALEAAGTYGNLFQAFGETQENATKMSTSLVELAADLASFNNTSVDDALLALRSGLSGETEPLKRYGIALSDARMRQELMAKGVKNLGATLTPLQKTQAAYTLILKDSTLAQGDFARTSDGLANKQRQLDAKLEDLSATVGKTLVPVMKDLVGVAVTVIDSLDDMGLGIDDAEKKLRVASGSGSMAAEAWARSQDMMREKTEALYPQVNNARNSIEGQRKATQDAKRATDLLDGALDGMTKGMSASEEAARRLADAIKTTDEAFDDLSGAMFDLDIVTGRVASKKKELDDLLREGPESEKAEDVAIYAGRVAELEKELFELMMQEAKLTGSDAFYKWIVKQTGALEGQTRQLAFLAQGRALLSGEATPTITSTYVGTLNSGGLGSFEPRASGGPVSPGGRYTVGEEGPETLVMHPSGGGYVIPNSGGASDMSRLATTTFPMPSGGVTVTLNIGDFHGTEDNIHELNRRLGETVRAATVRRGVN